MTQTDSSWGVDFSVSLAESINDGSVVTVCGELDLATAPKLRRALESTFDGGGEVEVDLRGCGFIDSSGVATLVFAGWKLKEQHRTLRIRGARDRVRGTFDLVGLAGHPSIVLEAEHGSG